MVITINLDEMYKEYSKMVYAFLYSMCKNRHLAEDLTQDTFLKAYKNIEKYDENRKMSTWLCEIAKNLYIDHTRKHKNKEIPDDLLVSETLGKAEENHNTDNYPSVHDILKLVHSLDEPYKEVFLLRYSMGFSYGEIADLFGEKEGWARLVYYRSRKMIQKKIKEMPI